MSKINAHNFVTLCKQKGNHERWAEKSSQKIQN